MAVYGEFTGLDNVADLLGDVEGEAGYFITDGAVLEDGDIAVGLSVSGFIPQESLPIPGVQVSGALVRGIPIVHRANTIPGVDVAGEIVRSAALSAFDQRLPAPNVTGFLANSDTNALLPGVRVSGTIAGSPLGNDGLNLLPGLRVTGEIVPPTAQLRGSPLLPPVSVSGEVLNGAATDASRIRIAVDVAGSIVVGGVLDGALTLPGVQVLGAWYEVPVMSSGEIAIPLTVSGTIFGPAVGVATGDALALNTRTLGLTRYESFALNSFAVVGSRVLAAGVDGIYEITGDADGSSSIEARFTTGHMDFGAKSAMKLVGMFVSYRSGGELEVTLRVDDAHEYVYRLPETRASGVYRNRVKFGRGARGRYFQVSVANADGADFSIDAVEYETQALARRLV